MKLTTGKHDKSRICTNFVVKLGNNYVATFPLGYPTKALDSCYVPSYYCCFLHFLWPAGLSATFRL